MMSPDKESFYKKVLSEATSSPLTAGEVLDVLALISNEIKAFALNTSAKSFVGLRLDMYGNIKADECP